MVCVPVDTATPSLEYSILVTRLLYRMLRPLVRAAIRRRLPPACGSCRSQLSCTLMICLR